MAKKLALSCVRGNGEGRGKRTESNSRNGPIWNKKKEMGKRKEGKRERSEAAKEGREVRDNPVSLGEEVSLMAVSMCGIQLSQTHKHTRMFCITESLSHNMLGFFCNVSHDDLKLRDGGSVHLMFR